MINGRYYLKKRRRKMKIKQNIYNFKSVTLILLKIIIINFISTNEIGKLQNYFSEIYLVIQSSGTNSQKLIHNNFSPSEVYINGNKDETCINTCSLPVGKNNVTLRFESQINSCYNMFNGITNIKEIDLSNFDFSKVQTAKNMFKGCSNLEKINFNNINTNSLTDMENMFESCSKLEYLDLSNFNTSKVSSMYCTFEGCTNLKYIDLSSFDTSNVGSMQYMFSECKNLKYLDLSHFNTLKVTTIFQMFYQCFSLVYLNLKSFSYSNELQTLNALYNINDNIKLCAEDASFINQFSGKSFNCSDKCFDENIKVNDICIESCDTYEYKNICLDECPKGTLINNNICEDNPCLKNNQNLIECLDNTPEGYYFDAADELYKKCFEDCKFCNGPKEETNDNCIEYKYGLLAVPSNSYKICPYLHYLDDLDIYHCTENNMCPDNFELISGTKECRIKNNNDEVNNNISTENVGNFCEPNIDNIIPKSTSNYELIKKTDSLNLKETNENSNKMVSNYIGNISQNSSDYIKSSVIKEDNTLLYNLIKQILFRIFNFTIYNNYTYTNLLQENNDKILTNIREIIKHGFNISIIDEGKIPSLTAGEFNYLITSTLIKELNNNNNIIVDLGKCEEQLKYKYNISKNDSLYLLIVNGKIDNIPKIEYEVFYPFSPTNFTTLNLTHCKDMKVDISIPINISMNDIDFYNKSSGLYNDICYTLTTESETDISLKDRRNEYIEKNYSICEEDCDFTEYDNIAKRAKCTCMTKLELPLISKITVDKKKLLSNFKYIRNVGNFKMLKCIHLFLNKNNIFKNYANYFVAILFIISLLALFIFYLYSKAKIIKNIEQIIKEKRLNKTKEINNIDNNILNINKKEKIKNKK